MVILLYFCVVKVLACKTLHAKITSPHTIIIEYIEKIWLNLQDILKVRISVISQYEQTEIQTHHFEVVITGMQNLHVVYFLLFMSVNAFSLQLNCT
jgi:hypothetical protein